MDSLRNPYAPGAGTQPPELAGRDKVREQVHVALSGFAWDAPPRVSS